jgi:hypothetical protein
MPMLRAVRLFNAMKIGSVLGTDAEMTSAGISGTSLESYLTVGDAASGRRSDVSEMLSMRDQVRLLGSSVTGMTAILNSPKARELAFTYSDEGSRLMVHYMVDNSVAMGLITKNAESLTAIVNNDTAMEEFIGSASFEGVDGINALNSVMMLAGIAVGTYTSMPLLIEGSLGASGDVADSIPAMKVAAQSTSVMNAIAADGPMVDSLLGKSDQVDTIIASDIAMYELVRSTTALGKVSGNVEVNAKIAASPTAIKVAMASPYWHAIIDDSSTIAGNLRNVLVNGLDLDATIGATSTHAINHFDSVNTIASSYPAMQAIFDAAPTLLRDSPIFNAYVANFNGAKTIAEHTGAHAATPTTPDVSAAILTSIAGNSGAWTKYKAGPYFSDNLVATICSLTGLDPISYPAAANLAASSTALTAIVLSTAATEALSTASGVLDAIIAAGHIGIILGSATAMTYFGTEAGLSAMLANSATHSSIFGPASGASARAAILQSTVLVDQMGANADIVSIISATTIKATPTNLRAGTTSTNEAFGGFPTKFIAIALRANNIGAIAANYYFTGSPMAGTGATAVIPLKGTVTESVFFGFTDATWTVSGIAATAAVWPEVTYYDMT